MGINYIVAAEHGASDWQWGKYTGLSRDYCFALCTQEKILLIAFSESKLYIQMMHGRGP